GVVGATASVRGGARSAAFASSKFALRGLAQAVAREFGPVGVHVVHVVIDARLSPDGAPGTLRADQVADTIVATLDQPASAGWTFELDLRTPGGTW
ncbi:MAG: oxidoreductase, partial [Myxococcota bacterium]